MFFKMKAPPEKRGMLPFFLGVSQMTERVCLINQSVCTKGYGLGEAFFVSREKVGRRTQFDGAKAGLAVENPICAVPVDWRKKALRVSRDQSSICKLSVYYPDAFCSEKVLV